MTVGDVKREVATVFGKWLETTKWRTRQRTIFGRTSCGLSRHAKPMIRLASPPPP
jgi:hypothetical protein